MYTKKKKGASIYSSGVSNTLFLTTAMGKKIHTQRTTHVYIPSHSFLPSFLRIVTKISLKIRVRTRDQMLVFESKRKEW
jgi:hypothetical protein